MSSRLNNYIRTCRKRSGLSQYEVAFLLGAAHHAKLSRYEQGHRIPPLRTALALAYLFHISPPSLFGGIQDQVEKSIEERICLLRSELERKCGLGRGLALATRKQRWLDEHHAHVSETRHLRQ